MIWYINIENVKIPIILTMWKRSRNINLATSKGSSHIVSSIKVFPSQKSWYFFVLIFTFFCKPTLLSYHKSFKIFFVLLDGWSLWYFEPILSYYSKVLPSIEPASNPASFIILRISAQWCQCSAVQLCVVWFSFS